MRYLLRTSPLVLAALLCAAAAAGSGPPPDAGTADGVDETVCPVCRVHEGETEAEPVRASAEFQGETYGFCSEDCRDAFLEDPVAYLPPVFPRPAPEFKVRDLEGGEVTSAELGGRAVLLDFWATWCAPCVQDLPRLSALHQRFADDGFAVVGISIDEGDSAARQVTKMLRKRKASHPVYLDSVDEPAWGAFHVRVVPTQFLLDAGGNVVDQWSGKIDLAVVEAAVEELLGNVGGQGLGGSR